MENAFYKICAAEVRIGWDDSLPEDLHVRWEKWKFSLQDKRLMTQRCYHPQGFVKIVKTELHHFSDASSLAYGACSYRRFENDKGEIHCVLIMVKARVAPLEDYNLSSSRAFSCSGCC